MAPQLQQLGCSKKRFCGVCGVVLRPTDERTGRMPTVQGNDVTVSAKILVRGPLVRSKAVVAVGEIKKKRGAGRLPVFSFSVCRRLCRRHRRRRAPQKRCVNGCQNSRPGGVILPPLPCTSNYNFAFTPVLRSAQAKSLRAPSANCKSPRCFTFHRAVYFRARYYLTAFRLPKRAA